MSWNTTTVPNGAHVSVSNATTTNATLSVTATGRSGPTITSNPTTFILTGDASVTGNIQ